MAWSNLSDENESRRNQRRNVLRYLREGLARRGMKERLAERSYADGGSQDEAKPESRERSSVGVPSATTIDGTLINYWGNIGTAYTEE